jgi:hypothetical protein
MKSHLLIAFGLLVAGIFLIRGLEALAEPGWGLLELYILGGFVLAGLLVRQGFKLRQR